jgi:hypothetical protein
MKNNSEFLRDCALYIKGDLSEVKISGKEEVTKLFANVISESRRFYLALEQSDSSKVIPTLKRKRAASTLLREKTGYIWPL